jgi:glutathione S-transferase
MKLCYSAVSPFCRKVRMALDHKGLSYEIVQVDQLREMPLPSPRAEVPALEFGGQVVCNSPDILAFIDRIQPSPPLYPQDPAAYADVKRWEQLADTRLDAIVSVVGIFHLVGLPQPQGLAANAAAEILEVYDDLDARLATGSFLCGADPCAADWAVYPHVSSGAALGLGCHHERHRHVLHWLRRIRATPPGQGDVQAVRDWWHHRPEHAVDTQRVNWGTFRLEWLLANGHVDWFAEQVRSDRVLWSVGPNRQRVSRQGD